MQNLFGVLFLSLSVCLSPACARSLSLKINKLIKKFKNIKQLFAKFKGKAKNNNEYQILILFKCKFYLNVNVTVSQFLKS